ncbi:aminoacyl-tRNA hydrolase [Cadophora gregata]|uniref:aminoacyl-tRNA hydrolase n=1 Tax=Cadophora gregata TaxID=51156 RepID=UPI0026DD16DC|nr:aminoacyl-tRNA hydrolase [Cadophora gregata]KAK0121528.1 aminoacyl-tRNA hydrolase [Cadophora gregata]KAK0127004.1 aminoacyl-tRNA hydrolase [Cadophora gregata f. sp. sojae]
MSQPSSPDQSQNLSRKQRRQLRLRQELALTLTSSDTENDSDTLAPSIHIPRFLSMASPIRLLVCSIGNPGPYINTLHSAGHTVLSALASSLSYPSFQKSRAYANGLISIGSDFTLWQSASLMNVSGPSVASAWRQFQKESRGEDTRLVVVHDELEIALGQVKVRPGTASAKGHNGLKSIGESLGGKDYMRIGVGIGRPESRDKRDVADYVLKKMSMLERGKIEGAAGKVEMELRRLSQG